MTEEIRSGSWLLVVAGGVALGLAFIAVVALGVRNAIADEPISLRSLLRRHAHLVGSGLVIILATVVFAVSAMAPDTVITAGSRRPTTTVPLDDLATVDETGAPAAEGTAPGQVGAPGGVARPGAAVAGPTVPIKEVFLFQGQDNTRGITDDAIKICGHAPLLLGPTLNTEVEDLLVFWRKLNDEGGIHGRRVEISLEDDRYESQGGIPAAERCKEKNPFFISGAIGADVTAPVKVWAEQNRELYIYGFSVYKGSEKLKYSYTATITAEDISRVLARIGVSRFPDKKQKIGLLWRNSSNVEPAAVEFRNEVRRRGGKIVADIPVLKSQGNYAQEIIELQQAGAEVVYIGDDALSQINIMKQAKQQRYSPNWLIFSFNLQTQTLGDDALEPPLIGANLSPAYEYGQYGGTYASYAAEMKEFEAAYARYSPDTDLSGPAGDVAFGTWLGAKASAALLQACGRDCTRNKLAGIFEAGYKARLSDALCEIDFSKDAHHGGYAANIMEAYRTPSGRAGWRNIERCATAR